MDTTLKFTFEDGTETLAHYGVLGMRWGVRHDKEYKTQKARINSAYKAKRKKYQGDKGGERFHADLKKMKQDRKAAINKAKVDTANRLYSGNSREANRRIQTRGTAKTLGMASLMGSYGSLQYDRSRAEGENRGEAAVKGVLSNVGNRSLGGAVGLIDYLNDRSARKYDMRSRNTTTNDISLSGRGSQTDEVRSRRLKQRMKN